MKKKLITALVTLVMCGRLLTPNVAVAGTLSDSKLLPYIGYEPGDEDHIEIESRYRFNLIIREGRHSYDIVAIDEVRITSADARDVLFYNEIPLIFEVTTVVRHKQGSTPMFDAKSVSEEVGDAEFAVPSNLRDIVASGRPVIIPSGATYVHWSSANTRVFIDEYTPTDYAGLVGDVDGDGAITVTDAQYTLKYYTCNVVAGMNLTWAQILGREAIRSADSISDSPTASASDTPTTAPDALKHSVNWGAY